MRDLDWISGPSKSTDAVLPTLRFFEPHFSYLQNGPVNTHLTRLSSGRNRTLSGKEGLDPFRLFPFVPCPKARQEHRRAPHGFWWEGAEVKRRLRVYTSRGESLLEFLFNGNSEQPFLL